MPLDDDTARSTMRLLSRATAGSARPEGPWREQRDRWVDALDPAKPDKTVSQTELPRLVDFVAESEAAPSSRMTPDEWRRESDAVVARLLGAL